MVDGINSAKPDTSSKVDSSKFASVNKLQGGKTQSKTDIEIQKQLAILQDTDSRMTDRRDAIDNLKELIKKSHISCDTFQSMVEPLKKAMTAPGNTVAVRSGAAELLGTLVGNTPADSKISMASKEDMVQTCFQALKTETNHAVQSNLAFTLGNLGTSDISSASKVKIFHELGEMVFDRKYDASTLDVADIGVRDLLNSNMTSELKAGLLDDINNTLKGIEENNPNIRPGSHIKAVQDTFQRWQKIVLDK